MKQGMYPEYLDRKAVGCGTWLLFLFNELHGCVYVASSSSFCVKDQPVHSVSFYFGSVLNVAMSSCVRFDLSVIICMILLKHTWP